jgi:hypothetical protein
MKKKKKSRRLMTFHFSFKQSAIDRWWSKQADGQLIMKNHPVENREISSLFS